MEIRTDAVRMELGENEILKGIDISAENREFIGVIGPNGCGKSTLLKCIYRVLQPTGGAVMLDGNLLSSYRVRESAKKVAVVAQHNPVEFEFSVLEMVLMGRSPHKRALDRDNAEDYEIAYKALDTVGMREFEKRMFTTLSGGERQRVMLAQALTQQTQCLILDEPTNHLDIKYQLQIMDIVKGLNLTVIAAIHDLNLAAMYCDRIYVMQDGLIAAEGTPAEVLTEDLIRTIYEVRAEILTDSRGRLRVLYTPMS